MEENAITIIRLSDRSWFRILYKRMVIDFDPGYEGDFDEKVLPLLKRDGKSDYIIASHHHFDHVQLEALRRIVKSDTIIIAPTICQSVIPFSFHRLANGETYRDERITLATFPSYNTPNGRSTRKYHYRGDGNGYVIALGDKRIYFAGDTDIIADMHNLGEIDVAMLPIGGVYVMDAEEAIEAAAIIEPKYVVSMHETDVFTTNFEVGIKALGIRPIILEVGESFRIA